MEATNVPSKVPVLFNCPPFKFRHVPFRVQPSPASISHYSLPHPVYHSVSMNYLLFSLVLPGLCLCCCSFYIECPSSLISMMNFYSLFKTHLRGYLPPHTHTPLGKIYAVVRSPWISYQNKIQMA